METFSGSAGTTTSRISGLVHLPIGLGGEAVEVVLRVAQTLVTMMVLGTEFMSKSVKLMKLKRCRIVPEVARPIEVIASFSDSKTAHIGLAETEEN